MLSNTSALKVLRVLRYVLPLYLHAHPHVSYISFTCLQGILILRLFPLSCNFCLCSGHSHLLLLPSGHSCCCHVLSLLFIVLRSLSSPSWHASVSPLHDLPLPRSDGISIVRWVPADIYRWPCPNLIYQIPLNLYAIYSLQLEPYISPLPCVSSMLTLVVVPTAMPHVPKLAIVLEYNL
jgi:hypothetical protein